MSKEDAEYEKNWEVDDDDVDKTGDDNDEDDDEGEDYDDDDEDDRAGDKENDDDDEEEGESHNENEGDDAEYDDDDGDDGEDDDDDDDDVKPPPLDDDDDDPEYSGVDPRGHPAEYYQPEYNPEDEEGAEFKDEPEERQENRGERIGERSLMCLCVVLCCCVMLALLALVLVLVVFQKDDSDNGNKNGPTPTFSPSQPAQIPTPAAPMAPVPFSYPTLLPVAPPPSAFPTRSPIVTLAPTNETINTNPTMAPSTFPTIKPTTTPSPTKSVEDAMVLIPVEDTYIVDGFFKFENHGSEETFLVQNSADDVQEIPDSFALLKFDLSSVPFARIQNRQLSATLELTHQVSVLDRGPATYTMVRLNSTVLEVETLHLGIFPLPENGINGTSFDVAPSDESVSINVTDLIFGKVYQPSDDDQAFLMIVNYGIEQEAGDRFFTRESTGNEPKLRLSMIRTPGVPDSTAAPTKPPTLAPTPLFTGSEAPSIFPTNTTA